MPAFRATGPGARIPPPFSGRDFASRGWAFRTSGSTATRCRSRRSEPRRASGRACSGFPRTSSARCRERAGRRRPATRRQGPPGPAAPRPRHCPGPRCPGLAPSSARVEFLLQPIGFSFASPHARRTVRPTAPDRAFLPRQPGGAADGGEGTDREGLAPVPRGGGRNRLELAPGAFGCCCSFWSGWRGWGSSRCSFSWPPFRLTRLASRPRRRPGRPRHRIELLRRGRRRGEAARSRDGSDHAVEGVLRGRRVLALAALLAVATS